MSEEITFKSGSFTLSVLTDTVMFVRIRTLLIMESISLHFSSNSRLLFLDMAGEIHSTVDLHNLMPTSLITELDLLPIMGRS